nr:MAG TPA: hypothetical protein [Caudoviricetes sp.]
MKDQAGFLNRSRRLLRIPLPLGLTYFFSFSLRF